MRCCAHILNLIVQDGLSVINEAIKKVRHIVQFWTATTKRLEKFEESARQLRIPSSKKLSLDCKTRWNSTYLMLEVAVKNKEVFYRLQQRENKLALRREDVPSEDDWTNNEKNCEKMKIFYETTLLFSCSKFVTSNLGFPKICEIRLTLMEWCCSPDQMISSMASEMLVKFKKYWDTTNEVLGVGSVLDPRYKLCLLEFYFEKIYGEEKVESEVDRVREVCYALLHEYQTKSSSAMETDGSSVMTKSEAEMSDYDLFVNSKKRKRGYVKSKLDHYLDEDVLPRDKNFEILTWWKSNGIKYPTLQKLARDIYVVHVSTVSSESALSMGGRLISPHRSRLHPDTVEALACSQSWLSSEMQGFSESNGLNYATIIHDMDVDISEVSEDSQEVEV